jgi:cytochrome c553
MAHGEHAIHEGHMGESTGVSSGRWLRRISKVVGALLAALLVLAVAVFALSERRIRQRFEVAGEALEIPTGADVVRRGERLARSRGCMDCHAANGAGQVFLRAMPVMDLHPSNLTPGGATSRWEGRDWTRAVRHCVRPDGSGIPFMPCEDYRYLDDRDLGDIVAFLRALPASTNNPGPSRIGPVGRVLFLKGDLPYLVAERIDHAAVVPPAPPAGPTVAYGRYLAAGCTGCHGAHFSGGPIPGTPPEWPPAANITPDPATGIAAMTEAQFVAAVTRGQTRDGRTINPTFMPWRQFALLTPDEVAALWRYLREVPPRRAGRR